MRAGNGISPASERLVDALLIHLPACGYNVVTYVSSCLSGFGFFFQLICSPSEWLPLHLQFSGHSVFLIGKFHKINEPPVSGASMSKRNLGLSLLFPESFLIFP